MENIPEEESEFQLKVRNTEMGKTKTTAPEEVVIYPQFNLMDTDSLATLVYKPHDA